MARRSSATHGEPATARRRGPPRGATAWRPGRRGGPGAGRRSTGRGGGGNPRPLVAQAWWTDCVRVEVTVPARCTSSGADGRAVRSGARGRSRAAQGPVPPCGMMPGNIGTIHRDHIEDNEMKTICVVGTGYVGLVTGACFADLGNRRDLPRHRRARRSPPAAGRDPHLRAGAGRDGRSATSRAGRLRFTTSYAEALPEAEFCFIAVNTPSGADGEADMGAGPRAAARLIADAPARPRDHRQQEHRADRHRRLGRPHRRAPRPRRTGLRFGVVSQPGVPARGLGGGRLHAARPRRAGRHRPRRGRAVAELYRR